LICKSQYISLELLNQYFEFKRNLIPKPSGPAPGSIQPKFLAPHVLTVPQGRTQILAQAAYGRTGPRRMANERAFAYIPSSSINTPISWFCRHHPQYLIASVDSVNRFVTLYINLCVMSLPD